MSLLPKSIHRCRRYPTKFNSGRDIPLGWPMGARILSHEDADPALDLVGRRRRWLAPA